MIKFGYKRAICMDVMYNTNILDYLLWSLLIFDDWSNGIPMAWMLTSQLSKEDLTMWLEPLQSILIEICSYFLLMLLDR